MLIYDFNYTIDAWVKELERYSFMQLCAKPSPKQWSLGQVFMHLIEDTNYYIEQIKICISTNDHSNEEISANGKAMLQNNEFPDEVIEGAPANAFMPQPESKEQLLRDLVNIKNEMNKLAALISSTTFKGKTKHPGLNYFDAKQWLQFADMHFRHHLRQKKRIDDFLRTVNAQ